MHREKDRSTALIEPVDLLSADQEDAADHQLRHTVGMCFGVGQREGRPPATAENLPSVYAQVHAELLDIGHEVPCGVFFERGVGGALTATALVEKYDAVLVGMKKRLCLGSEPPPGPPWRKTTGLPLGFPLSSK